MRRGHTAIWGAMCLVILAWAAAMAALEPTLLDGWYVERWLRDHDGFVAFAHANWSGDVFWGNARLGQLALYATYGGANVVLTPLVVVALLVLLQFHVRRRWVDPWALLVVFGVLVLAQPQLGPVLFYRPFSANYALGLVVQLAWLVAYRGDRARPGWFALPMVVLGLLAGACAEHTGVPLALAVGIAVARRRASEQLRREGAGTARGRDLAWRIAGLVGFVAGYAWLMLAPVQSTRYCGVGDASVLERIVDRGFLETLEILVAPITAGRWAWFALAVVLVAANIRRVIVPWRAALPWLAIALAIAWILVVSPKQGDRLLFAPLAFATIAITILIDALGTPRAVAVVAGLVVAGAIAWSLRVAVRVHVDHGARIAVLSSAAPGSVPTVPVYREGPSRWFLGDDLPSDTHRAHVAAHFGLAAIDVEGYPAIPFHYALHVDGATRRFPPLRGLCETRREVEQLARPAELVLEPRTGPPIVTARHRDGRWIAPSATVTSKPGGRSITIDPGGLPSIDEVRVLGPGHTESAIRDGDRWSYAPWQRGTYWIIVCSAADCYLAEIARHTRI